MDGFLSGEEFRTLEPQMRALQRGEFITTTKDFTDKQRFAISNFPNTTIIVVGRKEARAVMNCVCRHEDHSVALQYVRTEVAKLLAA